MITHDIDEALLLQIWCNDDYTYPAAQIGE